MEPIVKCDQGYESFDSMSACGSERKSSLSDAEFDPISDDENDEEEYSKPGVDDGIIHSLSEKLKDGMSLVSRAPMKNIDSVRENRRESAQPWSVQTQNSVTPSGGRLIRTTDKNDTYIRQHNNFKNIFSSQNVLTSSANIMTTKLQTQNVMTTNLQRNNNVNTYNNLTGQNLASNNFTSTNIASNNLTSTSLAGNNIISTNLTGNNIISKNLSSNNIISKNLTNYHQVTNTNLENNNSANLLNNNLGYIYKQTPVASSDDVCEELQSLGDFPELQEYAKLFSDEEDNSLGCIRYLFPDILPELSASDVNEGLGHIDQNIDFGKVSPVSFSSTIVPPSVDSYPPSPVNSDLLAVLTSSDQDAVQNHCVVPDILSLPPHSSDSDDISTLLADSSGILDQFDILSPASAPSGQMQTLNVPSTVTKYTSLLSDSSTYASSSNSFLNIRDQRVSFSTNSTPSHPGSVEYSPLSSAESQPSPYSNSSNDLELYQQQYSPNIIPVTVNDDLGEDDASRASSRQDNVSAKERLYQKIMADAMLKRAKDSAWFEASKAKQEKLVIMIQKLCKSSNDKYLEAKLYANLQVYLDNASEDEIVQLFKSVTFLQHPSIVNNPLLTAYIREIMFNHGLE